MSEEIAKKVGLEIGQKVLHPYYKPNCVKLEIVTIKDVRILPNEELVVDVEEYGDYINYSKIYTQYQINNMFELSGLVK